MEVVIPMRNARGWSRYAGVASRFAMLLSRYGSLAIQFVLVILVARFLTKADAGLYLLLYGAVSTTAVFVGLGASDALVRSLPTIVATRGPDTVRAEVGHASRFTLITGGITLGLMISVGALLRYPAQQLELFGLWWISYSSIFFFGQVLVALGKPTKGAFVWYALNSLCQVFSTMPYLAFAMHPTGMGMLLVTVASSYVAALISFGLVWSEIRRYPAKSVREERHFSVRFGLIIAGSRTVQGALYWIPAWAIGIARGPAEGAVMSAAGRLLLAAAAVIAVFRFTLRGRIAAAHAVNDMPALERMCRSAATISTGVAVAGFCLSLVVGGPVVALVFGQGFREAGLVLTILLVGAIFESVGGPVDEVVRFAGYEAMNCLSLICCAGLEVALAFMLAPFGIVPVAFAQVISFGVLYALMILYARVKLGVLIIPYTRWSDLRGCFRA